MSESLIAELVGNNKEALVKNRRVQRAKEDFGFFCRTYLGDYFFTDPAEYQEVLYDVANTQSLSPWTVEQLQRFVHEKYHKYLVPTERLAGAMFVEPREHGKTVRWSFAYTLWRVLSGKSRYVLLIGAAAESAVENLTNIKIELEENEAILEDFGDLRGKEWRKDRLELTVGSCIQAKGAGASMRGTRFRQYRPDLIILDDILKDSAVDSPTLRNGISRWLKKVVFNLGKTAFIIWVNTIFHSDDPISRLMRELEEGTLKRWIAVRLDCYRPDGEPLWPEHWSKEALAEKQAQLGFDVFSTEYRNEPLSDEERIIKPEWIETNWYTTDELPPLETLRIFGGVDPATGKHDRTAILTLGVDRLGRIWELDTWAKVCSESETVQQLIIKHSKYAYELIAWEEVTFSGIYANYVSSMAAEQNVYLPIRKVKAGTDSKIARVRSISPLIENGIIRIRKNGAKDLIDELASFPKGRFDDMCDALAYAVKIVSSGPATPMGFVLGRASKLTNTLQRFRRGY